MRRAMRHLRSLPYVAWRVRRVARRTRAVFQDLLVRLISALTAKPRTPPWVMIPIFGLVGLNIAAVYSWTIPNTFVSASVIGLRDGYIVGVNSEDEKRLGIPSRWWFTSSEAMARLRQIQSRVFLTRLIHEEGLYQEELARMPLEDLTKRMETSDIKIQPVAGSRGKFALSFSGPSAALAQGAAWNLAAEFVDGTSFSILESANLPVHPEDAQRLQITALGLAGGVLAGALVALFMKLKVWRLAMAMGIAGALATFIIPQQYTSTALVGYDGTDEWSGMRELISAATRDPSLYGIVLESGVYDNLPGASTKLLEHLRITPTLEPDAKAVVISFVDSRPLMAQKVAQLVASMLVQNSLMRNSSIKVELLDPASLPVDPSFPDRPIAAVVGLFLGLACAIAMGIWRNWKGSYPWNTTNRGYQVTPQDELIIDRNRFSPSL